MEYVPGGSLYTRLFKSPDQEPLSVEDRINIAVDILTALSYLHGLQSSPDTDGPLRSVLHQDIKSRNVVLTSDHRAKLIDVGLSKIMENAAGVSSTGLVMIDFA
jgi:serine/threonine protein kinase